ncbi:hypothetical protein LTR10_013065 [Elasticomyces elasticus]|uniref:Uncharacterized protein n=1 Tax=Exophiala sideris TaxID=1016849 RepID=A0ABR0JAN7_9EURO|nr:hypothetical protein LTR10_013065 [Elasticomyces elasticus]KAK5030441.1 hypothetical protein LTS07_005225 [Exophiala sideris]KAK5038494.1 hypothetical protein LTR13_004241 [Exophiala sideris]KAK5060377.1 hypothetical protein LTR69_005694 [Exophiala sideris]KAK5183287.1 hypothetical protein LTR44_004288 [Eurotiomycetes sp. CCFEE 6388]
MESRNGGSETKKVKVVLFIKEDDKINWNSAANMIITVISNNALYKDTGVELQDALSSLTLKNDLQSKFHF